MKTIKAPKVPNVRCKTEEQCKAIGETLKEAYKTGRRFKRVGFKKPPKE